jgi:hypothetical protein
LHTPQALLLSRKIRPLATYAPQARICTGISPAYY